MRYATFNQSSLYPSLHTSKTISGKPPLVDSCVGNRLQVREVPSQGPKSFKRNTYKKHGEGWHPASPCFRPLSEPTPRYTVLGLRKALIAFMNKALTSILLAPLTLVGAPASAQTAPKPSAAVSPAAVEHLIDLAARGQCQEALPSLKKTAPHVSDKQLKYRAEMALIRCAMSLDQQETAIQAMWALNREFPNDPEILYIMTHYYSEIASRTSQQLAAVAPGSHQAHMLEAEAMESQGKWDDAVGEYKQILEQEPKLPGIHYRLGRVSLSRSQSPDSVAEAKKQFAAELSIDPTNAASEFFLGEIARQAGQWDEAIPRFSTAAKLDPGFAEAYLALGISLNSAERFQEGIAPLETYVKMLPGDPAGHYQLSISYSRTGRKQEAARELAAQQEITQRSPGAGRPANDGPAPQ
jgi:tetratricopeptide (TPR) repeat protein